MQMAKNMGQKNIILSKVKKVAWPVEDGGSGQKREKKGWGKQTVIFHLLGYL